MNPSFFLRGWLGSGALLAGVAQADILIIPGPTSVQVKGGSWVLKDLSVRLPLVSPPEWGKTVGPNTQGSLAHAPWARGEFRARITLENLEPNHAYTMTLNGRPDLPGNALLPDAVPGLPAERYYDFLHIQTDDRGAYQADVAVKLKPGSYQVRLYVKDRSDFKIVLYQDYFPFKVN